MKPFLLIMGSYDKPNIGIDDWEKCFKSRGEAEEYLHKLMQKFQHYIHWHEIVDLREWMNKE